MSKVAIIGAGSLVFTKLKACGRINMSNWSRYIWYLDQVIKLNNGRERSLQESLFSRRRRGKRMACQVVRETLRHKHCRRTRLWSASLLQFRTEEWHG